MARESLVARVTRLEERDRQREAADTELRRAIERIEARVFWLAVGGGGLGAAGGAGVAQLAGLIGGS